MVKKLLSYKFTIAAAALILAALLLPSKTFSHLPSFFGIDKLAHFVLFALFSAAYLVESGGIRKSLPSVAVSALSIGLFIMCSELLQLLTSSRSFELADMAFDAMGTIFAFVILFSLSKLFRKAPGKDS